MLPISCGIVSSTKIPVQNKNESDSDEDLNESKDDLKETTTT